MEGDAVEEYVHAVIKSDFEETGDDDVMRKVSGDLAETDISESDVRQKMDALLDEVMNSES